MLANYLNKKTVILKTDAEDKASLFRLMAEKAAAEGYITDSEAMAKAVEEKEKEGVMELKPGIVLPHARGSFVKQLFVIMGVFKDGIPYKGVKKGSAKLVFFIGVPEGDQNYLKLLAAVSRLLGNEDFIQTVLKSEVIDDVIYSVKKHSLKIDVEKRKCKKYLVILTLNIPEADKNISVVLAEAGVAAGSEVQSRNLSNGLSFLSFFSPFGMGHHVSKYGRTYFGLTDDENAAAEIYALLKDQGIDLDEHGTGSLAMVEAKASYGGYAEDIF